MTGVSVVRPRTRRDLVNILLILVFAGMIGTVVLRRILLHPLSPKERQEQQDQAKEASQSPGRPEDFAAQQQDRLKKATEKAEEERKQALTAAAKAASAAGAASPKGPGLVVAGTVGAPGGGNSPLPADYQVPPTATSVANDSSRVAAEKDKNPFANISLAAYEASDDEGQSAKSSLPPSVTDALNNLLPKGGASNSTEAPLESAIKGLADTAKSGGTGQTQNVTGAGPKNTQWLANEQKSDNESAEPLSAKRLASPYTLQAPGRIFVVALTGFNSTLPAEADALVTDDIYDNIPGVGTHLLIRKGSKLALHPNTDIARGQDRMMMAFTRLILYGGATVNLGAMGGSDTQGVGGIPADTDSHLLRRFGAATLLAGVSALAERSTSTGGVSVNLGSSVESSSETAISQLMTSVLGDSVNIQDTLTIKPGQRMTVVVNKDLYLPPDITGNAP